MLTHARAGTVRCPDRVRWPRPGTVRARSGRVALSRPTTRVAGRRTARQALRSNVEGHAVVPQASPPHHRHRRGGRRRLAIVGGATAVETNALGAARLFDRAVAKIDRLLAGPSRIARVPRRSSSRRPTRVTPPTSSTPTRAAGPEPAARRRAEHRTRGDARSAAHREGHPRPHGGPDAPTSAGGLRHPQGPRQVLRARDQGHVVRAGRDPDGARDPRSRQHLGRVPARAAVSRSRVGESQGLRSMGCGARRRWPSPWMPTARRATRSARTDATGRPPRRGEGRHEDPLPGAADGLARRPHLGHDGLPADADPTVFADAKINGTYILDPWYPDISSIWGRRIRPGRTRTRPR
jgi:hypothetical protein